MNNEAIFNENEKKNETVVKIQFIVDVFFYGRYFLFWYTDYILNWNEKRSVLILCHDAKVINDSWGIDDSKNGIKYSRYTRTDLLELSNDLDEALRTRFSIFQCNIYYGPENLLKLQLFFEIIYKVNEYWILIKKNW